MMKRLNGDWKALIQEVYNPPFLYILTWMLAKMFEETCKYAFTLPFHVQCLSHIIYLCMALISIYFFIFHVGDMIGTFMFVVILINGKRALRLFCLQRYWYPRNAKDSQGTYATLGYNNIKSLVTHNHLPHLTKPTTVVMVLYRTLWYNYLFYFYALPFERADKQTLVLIYEIHKHEQLLLKVSAHFV